MKKNMQEMKESENNVIAFFDSTGFIRFEEGTCAASTDIYDAYRKWCDVNLETAMLKDKFSKLLKQYAVQRGLRYDNNLVIGGGKRARGYHGVHVVLSTYR